MRLMSSQQGFPSGLFGSQTHTSKLYIHTNNALKSENIELANTHLQLLIFNTHFVTHILYVNYPNICCHYKVLHAVLCALLAGGGGV